MIVQMAIFFIATNTFASAEVDKLNEKYFRSHQEIEQSVTDCLEQNEDIVTKAVLEAPELEDLVKFEPDEQMALYYMEEFDVSKLSGIDEQSMYDTLIGGCTDDVLERFYHLEKERQSCDKVFDNYHFFKAMNNKKDNAHWSDSTHQLAKELTLEYLSQYAVKVPTLIQQMTGLTILETMARSGTISRKWIAPIVGLQKKAEALVSKRLRGDKGEANWQSCQDVFRALGQEYSDSLKISIPMGHHLFQIKEDG
ncbi:MAG: hypothetical protein HOE90_00475 [Bacteriovoracaceae bacterium]|nr:hypothetical protein [Bacteriovoracaceae bacterium]